MSLVITMGDDIWDENKYKHWIRGAKGLEFLQDGLKDFVSDKAPVCRDQQLQKLSSLVNVPQCNQCTSQNLLPDHANGKKACNNATCIERSPGNCFGSKPRGRRKCPNGICSKLYDAIVRDHRYNSPLWKGTDPTAWCSDPLGWIFAKCFQTTPGPATSAHDTDAAGLLSFIINSRSMQNWLACKHMGVKTMCHFQKAKDIRNDILHKAKMELDEQTLDGYLDIFIAVLQDPKYLATNTVSQDAVHKLTQLKSKQIHISQWDETKIRKMREEALSEIEERTQDALKKIEDATSAGMTGVKNTETNAMRKIKETVQEIKRSKITALSDMDWKGKRTLQGIKTTASIGETAVKKKKTEALHELKVATTSGLSDVNKTKADGVKELNATTSSGLSDLNRKTTEAMQEIEAKTNIMQEVIYKRQQEEMSKPGGRQPTTSLDEDESTVMSDLQDDLISFYRRQHRTIPLSPLIEEDSPLLKFYVMPEIKSLNVKRTGDGVKEEKTTVTPFGNVFYNENKICRNIYLTADAGLGKTAFSKRLALTWCHTKNPITEEGQFFSEEEIQAMHEFRFVFLLLLRDSSSECDIVDLIWTQVVSQFPPRYTRDKLEEILFKERSLVILDGLDEWCHPSDSCKQKMSSIPHRKAWEQAAVLTTTRPWKLSLSGLHSSQIDQKLEIMGLNQKSANALKTSVISHLCADKTVYEVQQDVKRFTKTLEEKQISDLETIPLLLMYLLFLWCNKIELGKSQCDLYSHITELLLSRTVQNYQELTPKVDIHQDNIPQCLSQQAHCKEFYSLLKKMGQLAYQTLFWETRIENTLVFDSSVAGHYLNKECLTFCLKTGIITQSKVPGALFPQKSKMSFAHKTVQEYFAALYIRSIPDQTSVQETVLSKCTCVKDILEMSKILIFLSGFNVNVSSSISRELMQIINEDEITREYRSSLQFSSEPLKQFQDMCVSCCKELPHDNEVNISLQDVFIDDSCEQEQYRENLKQLTSRNKQNIRSLHIHIDDMSRTPYGSVQKVIEYFALSDLENIEKIDYSGEYNDRDILPLLKSSVKSLSLWCSKSSWFVSPSEKVISSWSVLLYEKVTSLQNLEVININEFKMSHEQLTLLYDYISQRQCMRDICLRGLDCTDHERDSCTGCCLNLSKHSKLRKITLHGIPVSELNINMSSLEKCVLERLSNPDLVLRFINCVPADSKVNRFECYGLESSAAIETIQQTLPLLVHVEVVGLSRINLGNRNLLSTEMVNIKRVDLSFVTMPASVVRGIVTVLQQLTQTVTVDIEDCNITPESEFVTVKEEIKQSTKFRVSEDWEDLGYYGGWRTKHLVFETIKDGD